MGLGSTAKKVQKMVDLAEDLYTKVNELRQRLVETQETVDKTKERVDTIERDLDTQRELLEALAREEGIDVDALLAAEADEANEANEEAKE